MGFLYKFVLFFRQGNLLLRNTKCAQFLQRPAYSCVRPIPCTADHNFDEIIAEIKMDQMIHSLCQLMVFAMPHRIYFGSFRFIRNRNDPQRYLSL